MRKYIGIFLGFILLVLQWEIKPTGPNSKNGLGDTRCSRRQGFNDGLARSGVWWAGTPGTITANFYPLVHKALPGSSLAEFYGVTIFLEVT